MRAVPDFPCRSRRFTVAWCMPRRRPILTIKAAGHRGRRVRRPVPVVSLESVRPVLSVRPHVADLVFQLYGRVLHPELFEIRAARTIDRGVYSASIAITEAGHLVTWRKDGLTLTELAASQKQPLPQRRRLISHRIAGERSDRLECRGGACYQTCFQLETVAEEVFWTFQEELAGEGRKRGLLHRFESGGRLALGALSWINVETRPRGLIVQAFHTFPDDLAIVKSQSLFEAP